MTLIFDYGYNSYGKSSPVIESLSVIPSITEQTITASGGVDGYSPISVSAVTSSIDANIQAGNIVDGVSILGVSGSAIKLNGDTLSVTPSTSAQTITPTSPKNGFTQVSVSAVTSSIDNNITAGNIKNGITILGVTGNYSASSDTVTAKNNTGTSISSGDKVWICKDSGDSTLYLRTFTYAGEYSYTGFATSSGANGANVTAETVFPDSITIMLSTETDSASLNVR